MNSKPVILWILQENQVTPHIIDFLALLKSGLSKIDIVFLIPDHDRKALESLAPLAPKYFQISREDHGNTRDNFFRKQDLMKGLNYGDGLEAWRTLLLDDLGEGVITETRIHTEPLANVRGILLQIPTPMGSGAHEEYIFEAWVKWARRNNVFAAGYELLPLYNRWKLLPSTLDGIILRDDLSFRLFSGAPHPVKGKLWKLPRYEGNVFSVGAGQMWRTGLQVPYHFRMKYKIPRDKTVLYISHNVAMSYEYKQLIEAIQESGPRLHLMFATGKDQARGTHSHEGIIETLSGKSLDRFHSYSFHDLSAPWEMVMADAVAACTHNYSTMVAQANNIPCIIMDKAVPNADSGCLKVVSSHEAVRDFISDIMYGHDGLSDFTTIMYEIANREHPKLAL